MGALGAALTHIENPTFLQGSPIIEKIHHFLKQKKHKATILSPLMGSNLTPSEKEKKNNTFGHYNPSTITGYLGVDIGSISTNLVIIDDHNNLLAKRYLMTAGRPIEAVRRGLKEIYLEIGDKVTICGSGTTGSGRYLIGDFIGADIVKNEITAQAQAAFSIDPRVDTIFEIGGQDSKFIRLDHGVVVDFEMNKVCAAGTGSFLEEQAEKLGINIKKEFQNAAFASPFPIKLGERCTVFIESDLIHHQQNGAKKENLIAGLCYSIVYNYLNRVVGGKKIGKHIFFQGGVATNQAVVAAFKQVLQKEIIVPPDHEVTGAIGVAILALKEKMGSKSHFKGFDLYKRKYQVQSFECKKCANYCQIRKIIIDRDNPLFYGSRCDRYDQKKITYPASPIPDLFSYRAQELYRSYLPSYSSNSPGKKKMGIPLCLFFYELLPFWQTYFEALEFEVVLSSPTNKTIIMQGVQTSVADTCFPIKISYGHILDLLQKDVDYLFLPSIISMPSNPDEAGESLNCPYVQTIPYTISATLNLEKSSPKLLRPVIYFKEEKRHLEKSLIKLGRSLGKSANSVLKALHFAFHAQSSFYKTLQNKGNTIIKNLSQYEKVLVLISRPYNGLDSGLNLEIPKIFRDMGILLMPIDFLPFDNPSIHAEYPNMYWRYGQRILAAAHLIKQLPNCHPVYLTNFSCGPDSFITQFFQKIMKDKPFLQIEIDEHSAGAGIITRCEAFIDSLARRGATSSEKKMKQKKSASSTGPKTPRAISPEHTIYIPHMSEHAHAICSAFRSQGITAEVMPESDEKTVTHGRVYTCGKECYPFIVTTGDMIKLVKSPEFNPQKSAFFMPSGDGPCRFGQYNRFQRIVLNELGLSMVPIFAPTQGPTFYKELGIAGKNFTRQAWQGIVVIDLLKKWLYQNRPFAQKKEDADKIFQKCIKMLCTTIENNQPIFPILFTIRRQLSTLKTNPKSPKPIIGIVGEIFVRSNRFSNKELIRQIESLGGIAWLSPVTEWFHYINYTAKKKYIKKRNVKKLIPILITEILQKIDEKRIHSCFHSAISNGHDPSISQIIKNSQPYLHSSFEGEAILSIGKSIDFLKKNTSGIINVMPFSCMPGNISTTLLRKVQHNYGDFPILHLAFDGLEDTTVKTRLEAFLYQTRQFKTTLL